MSWKKVANFSGWRCLFTSNEAQLIFLGEIKLTIHILFELCSLWTCVKVSWKRNFKKRQKKREKIDQKSFAWWWINEMIEENVEWLWAKTLFWVICVLCGTEVKSWLLEKREIRLKNGFFHIAKILRVLSLKVNNYHHWKETQILVKWYDWLHPSTTTT